MPEAVGLLKSLSLGSLKLVTSNHDMDNVQTLHPNMAEEYGPSLGRKEGRVDLGLFENNVLNSYVHKSR